MIAALSVAHSRAFGQTRDAAGSRDHPLVARYAGSIIDIYDTTDFADYEVVLGNVVLESSSERYRPTRSQLVEGRVTKITYIAPPDRSTLEIYRNYEAALRKAGFEVPFAASGDSLLDYEWWHSRQAYPNDGRLQLLNDGQQRRYLAAKLSRADGDVHVALFLAVGNPHPDRAIIQLDVVDVLPMKEGLVTVDVMADQIAQVGRVALYGIYFDTGKADVKPESEPALTEMAKLLRQGPALKLHVVGHTDNAGRLPANMELSLRRAEAVVKVLTARYGVDPQRLRPFGAGPMAPVASNRSENGRAKNRRVELVEF